MHTALALIRGRFVQQTFLFLFSLGFFQGYHFEVLHGLGDVADFVAAI